jgi:hypothetical protein
MSISWYSLLKNQNKYRFGQNIYSDNKYEFTIYQGTNKMLTSLFIYGALTTPSVATNAMHQILGSLITELVGGSGHGQFMKLGYQSLRGAVETM